MLKLLKSIWFALLLISLATVAIMSGCGGGSTNTSGGTTTGGSGTTASAPPPGGTTGTTTTGGTTSGGTGTTTGTTTGATTGTTTGGTGTTTGGTGTTTGGTTTGGTTTGGGSGGTLATFTGSYQTIDIPNSTSTQIFGVNTAGQMVGVFTDQSGAQHGFILLNGQVTVLDEPDASTGSGTFGTVATAISDAGVVVGIYGTGSFHNGLREHGFIYQNGTFTSFDAPNNTDTQPQGVNSAGVIVGYGDLVACCQVSWIRNTDGTFTSLHDGQEPAGERLPTGINDVGVIVGPNFTFSNGTFNYFEIPGNTGRCQAQGISPTGNLAGFYVPVGSDFTAGFWRKGDSSYFTLRFPNAEQTWATDLNDSIIVGYYWDTSGTTRTTHGFVATPQ